MPFTNPYLLNDINDAIVTVGATTIALGPLPAGATVTRTFTVVIPSSQSCGSRYDVPVSVTSSFGTVTKTITLQIGQATSQIPEGTFSSGGVSLPILDNQTTDIPITVTGTGPVGKIRASVRLNHTFDGDLVLRLVAPDGSSVILSNNRGGGGDNFGSGANDCSGTPTTFDDGAATAISAGTAPFSGSFRPDQPLSGLIGTEMNGVWKLRISDTANLDTGTAFCATLELNEQLYFCCGVPGTPIVAAAPPATLVSECSSAANGAPDPGEIVTMSFPLRNVGSGLTTNLVATLLSGGGVTSLGGPQTYGVLSPVGPAVARPFELAISSAAACGSDVVATLALSDNGTDLGTVTFTIRIGATVANTYTFSNSASIAVPAAGTSGISAPYPSNIAVSGVAGTVTGVALTIRNFSHTFPGDVDLLLVSPTGQKFIPLSDLGGSVDAVNLTITLDDTAAAALPATFVSGTFRPGNSGTGDTFAAPAPAGPYQSPATAGTATFASVFGGSNPNGTWSLYTVDDAGSDIGSIAGGWTLTIRTADPVCAVVSPPSVSGATADPAALWPPNHQMRDVTVSYDAGTDCASCTLGVSSNEPENGTGDGDTSPDFEVVDNHHVRLRAERAGNGSGRTYTITITCVNGAGTSVQTVPVYVAHDISSPQAGASFRINTPVSFAGRFRDKAGLSHTAKWTFDSLSATGAVTEPTSAKPGSVTGTYSFAEPGVYRVAMNVTDNLGKTATVTNVGGLEAILVIYDPAGGYVVGGGWYDSPSGRSTFGFNSKYHSNAKNLKGEVQLTFGAGTNFEANNLDYLTITGARAQVGGQGKLNGDGPYNFILTMIDGQTEGGGGVDRIRLKVWHKVTGQVVYDTQPGASDAANPTTAVGTGSSIVLQK